MPARPSQQAISSIVGRRLMGGAVDGRQLERRLQALPPAELQKALDKHGLRGVGARQLSRVLSGQDKAGWSAGKLAGATKALQSLGIANGEVSVGRILMDSAKRAQQDQATHVSRQIAKNSALDFSRQTLSSRVASQRAHREKNRSDDQETSEERGRTIREIRDVLRQQLGLSQKTLLPRPGFGRKSSDAGSRFQP